MQALCKRLLTSKSPRIYDFKFFLTVEVLTFKFRDQTIKKTFLLTVTGDDVNNQTLNTKDEFGIEIIVRECDGYLGRGRIAFDL